VTAEEWRPIDGYDGVYEVSNMGNVRSWTARSNGKLLRSRAQRDGHILVNLAKNGRQTTYQIHRLVAEAFLGPMPSGLETRHLNGIPSDNRLANLAYGTRQENMRDKIIHGTDAGPTAENRSKTHCVRGHVFSPENTYMRAGVWRVCRKCNADTQRENRKR
jgi:hypothetical protein